MFVTRINGGAFWWGTAPSGITMTFSSLLFLCFRRLRSEGHSVFNTSVAMPRANGGESYMTARGLKFSSYYILSFTAFSIIHSCSTRSVKNTTSSWVCPMMERLERCLGLKTVPIYSYICRRDGQWLWDRAGKFARWQHHAMRRRLGIACLSISCK